MPWRHFVLVLLIVVVWGVNFVVIKIGLEGVPPIFLCFTRFFLTSIPAVFLIPPPKAPLKGIVSYTFVMFICQFLILFFAMKQGLSPALTSILLQLQAFFSLLMAAAMLGEKIKASSLVGLVLSFSGIALVGWNLGSESTLEGLLLVLLAAIFWGAGSILVKGMKGVDMIAVVVWGSLIAWPILLPLSLIFEKNEVIFFFENINAIWVGAIFYLAYFATLFGFSAWNWLLQQHSVAKIAPFSLLVPIVAMASSFFFLNEPIQGWKFMAAAFVVGGLIVNFVGSRVSMKKWSVSESNR